MTASQRIDPGAPSWVMRVTPVWFRGVARPLAEVLVLKVPPGGMAAVPVSTTEPPNDNKVMVALTVLRVVFCSE